MYKHLFVPVDGSALSARAVAGSIDIAVQLKARITGFVVEHDVPVTAGNTPHAQAVIAKLKENETLNEAHAKAILAKFEAAARNAGVPFDGLYVTTDAVDHAINEEAEKAGCDMIVMVTHGRSAFGEFVFGSHTKKLISLTRLPVLVLH